MLTQPELEALCHELETARVEKTESISNFDKFGEAICAFANDLANSGLPGYLIIGVKDKGTRVGIKIEEKLLQALLDFRTDGRIVPAPTLTAERFVFHDGEVAVVEVIPSHLPPVRFKGRVWIRAGAGKSLANEQEERILSEKRISHSRHFDSSPCLGSNLSDLSLGLFTENYLPLAVSADVLENNNRTKEEYLSSLRFYDLTKNTPTWAGILLFGKNPRYYLPGAYIQYVRFDGPDLASDDVLSRRFEGDLVTQIKNLRDFVQTVVVQSWLPNLGDKVVNNYPFATLIELLYNAIIHRDYQAAAPTRFYEFSNRIEIINPGGLFGLANASNFPTRNDYRNPVIAEAVQVLGYANMFNSGIYRAKREAEKNGNPDLKFDFHENTTFGVTIFKRP